MPIDIEAIAANAIAKEYAPGEHVTPQRSAKAMATAIREALEAEFAEQEAGALAYITAMVVKAGGLVEFTAEELREVADYTLERADPESGGLVLRAYKDGAMPLELPAKRAIILPPGLEGG